MSKVGWIILAAIVIVVVLVVIFLVIPPKHPVPEEVAPPETTSETETITTPDESGLIKIEASSYRYNPSEIEAPVDQEVTIEVTNTADILHTFTIDEFDIELRLTAGETESVTFTPTEPGQFDFYCSISGHRDQGMEGTLIVK